MERNADLIPPHSFRMVARIVAEDGLSAIVQAMRLHRCLTRIQLAADSSDKVRNYSSETAFGPAFKTLALVPRVV